MKEGNYFHTYHANENIHLE